jgi:hypothetical protein
MLTRFVRIRVERSASTVNAKTIIGTTKTHAARSVAVSPSVLKLLAAECAYKGSRPGLKHALTC